MKKIAKFFFSGLLTYAINMGLTYILVDWLNVGEKIAYFSSLLIITIINFTISLQFTFKKNFSLRIFGMYTFFLIFFSVINYFLVIFLKSTISGSNLYILIFFVTSFIFVLKYYSYDTFVFK
ncbi:hypothetical protein HGA92_01650 [Candidatus Gracilibacteria bacterium]|nr:hypothetical protein [Candidatus Gracilibacteria bacterium]NUJ98686.1 hypothetical protein [Candidatus Gracilibacteria bacterium]